MATLEIHDDRGQVKRVLVSREHTALFGSSPECEIVLTAPGILPVHGRLRWKGGRFKIDASPEARAIERNGKKVSSASFRIGDEVRVGPFRIFMVNPADGPMDEKTRVLTRPLAGQAFESTGWIKDLSVPVSSTETAVEDDEDDDNPIDASYDKAYREAVARREARAQAKQQGLGPWHKRWLRKLVTGDDRPGEERILTSPLVLGLVGTLAVLVLLGFSLWSIIVKTTAQRQYMTAVENYDNGDYLNAIRQFDEFLKANAKDTRASKARVLRALANVRQYTQGAAPAWTNALLAARAMVHQVGREPAYSDEATDLAEVVLKTAEGLADKARLEADSKVLAEAQTAIDLHAGIVGPKAAEAMLGRSRVPAKMEQARAAVRKNDMRTAALAAMDAALGKKKPAAVYLARDQLVVEYPDLAADRVVVDRLTKANELIRAAVSFNETRRPAETEPNPERLGPPVSLVFRSVPTEPASAHPSAVVYALADGFVYALDGATGAPLWHQAVGASSPFPPLAIPGGDPAALVFDSRSLELQRLDGRTGKLVWRQRIEELVAARPLVLGNQVVQPTPGGKLVFLDLATGELQGTLELGRALGPTPVSDEAGQFFYVLADAANLFIVKRDPLTCTAVEYTGHAPGSIIAPPARLSRFLILTENRSLNDGRWTVYEIQDDGAKVRPVQRVDVPGWTWSTPTAQGSVIWAVGDRGGPLAFAIGEEKVPLQPIAKIAADNQASGPAFARARTEREIWISSSRPGRYDLNSERGSISAAWTLVGAGPALAPIQTADRLVVMTQQLDGGPGTELWGVDPNDGKVRWQTVLGRPWLLPPRGGSDRAALSTLATNGRTLALDHDTLAKGGFLEQPLPKPGVFHLPAGPLQRIEADGATLIIPARDASQILVDDGSEELHTVDLPAPLGATPLVWNKGLLVPGGDGRIYLIDPRTGASIAEPIVPPFDREHPIRWLAPARLDAEAVVLADEVGTVRRLALSAGDATNRKLVVKAKVDLGAPLETDPVATETAILLITTDGRIRSLAARDLSPLGAWTLEAPRAVGPVLASGHAFVADRSGKVLAFGPDGQRAWSTDLKGAPSAGAPAVAGQVVLLLGRDGVLHRRALADGAPLEKTELGVLPAGGLEPAQADLVVPVAPGTVQLLKAEPANPAGRQVKTGVEK